MQGLCFDEQFVDTVPTGPQDEFMDYVVSSTRIITRSRLQEVQDASGKLSATDTAAEVTTKDGSDSTHTEDEAGQCSLQ